MLSLLWLLAACSPVALDDTPTDTLGDDWIEPPPEGAGFQMSMTAVAPPYTEVWACSVYPIPIDKAANVNWIEYQQPNGTHHMTLSTPGLFSTGSIPYGEYDCADLYGDQSLMEGQIQFFGAQGTAQDTMNLPEGIVANMPPGIDVIHEVHYVNTTDTEVDLYSVINAWTIPENEVVEGIWGGQVRDETIEIPPQSEKTEWTRCVMNQDVEVHFLASHTHAMATNFTIAPFDGTTTGDIFYENDDWHDPKIVQYDPPRILKAGEGFEYACTWKNETDETITYGLTAADEMCNLALVHTPFSMNAQCDVVETSDGVIWTP